MPEETAPTNPNPAPAPTPNPTTSVPEEKSNSRLYQIIYFILALIEVLLLIRFLLILFGANIETGFAQFIKNITDPFMAPFVGLFPTAQGETGVFSPSTIIAMIVYGLIFWGLVQLIQILTKKK